MPILKFQKTNKINLSQLRIDIPKFIVPRMYYYIDDTELLSYLEENLYAIGDPTINNFLEIKDYEF